MCYLRSHHQSEGLRCACRKSIVMSPRTLPPLNGLRAFEAAGRQLSFRGAAEELGVTQGATAQQVRSLEARLGIRLFVRLPRGLDLTEEGRAYHSAVSRAFTALADATEQLRPQTMAVTVTVTPTFAAKWLVPRLPEFTDVHPEIELRVLATERVQSFHADGVDLAVRQANPPFGSGVQADLLFRQEVVAVCAPGLLPTGQASQAEDLARLTLLHDPHDLWPQFWVSAFGEDVAAPRKGIRFSQTTLSLDAALAGQGVALASRFFVSRDVREGRLVLLTDASLEEGRDFYLLMPRKRGRPGAADAVRNWMLAFAEEQG